MRKVAAAVAAGVLLFACAAPAAAIYPPPAWVPGTPPPADGPPGPEFPTKQDKACQSAGVLPASDLSQPPPASLALNLKQAWTLSRGAGVTIALLDTGVRPNPRLPTVRGGGDYAAPGGDGLSDCDAHGTLVAGIIAAGNSPGDGFEGVAPEADLISIRQYSGAFRADRPGSNDTAETAANVRTIARGIVHAVNMGATVIQVSLPVCVSVEKQVDQAALQAAIGYAVHVRGALIVAAAGDTGMSGCEQNPPIDPGRPADPRNWRYVKTISTPAWFSPDVLSVGFTAAEGTPSSYSLTGPWISVGAPGTAIESLDPGGGGVVNGVGESGKLAPVGGTSFAAAYVTGTAALLRSRFPNETPSEIAARLQASAHAPARGVDNTIGAGVIDPVAALGYRTPPAPPDGLYLSSPLAMPTPERERDWHPAITAIVVMVAALVLGVGANYVGSVSRRRL